MKGQKIYSKKDIAMLRRRRKQREAAFRFLTPFFIFSLVFFGIVRLASLELFFISDINFVGLKYINERELRASLDNYLDEKYAFFIPKKNILVFSADESASYLISRHSRIEGLDIKKDYFSKNITIDVTERDLWAILCSINNEIRNCYYISKSAKAFGQSPEFSGFLMPKIYVYERSISIGENALTEQEFNISRTFISAAEKIPEFDYVELIFKGDKEDVEIMTGERWKMILSYDSDPNLALENLLLSLRAEIKERRPFLEYIDLRSSKKVQYKFLEQ